MFKISIVVPLAHGRDIEGIDSINRQGKSKDIEVIKEFGDNPSANRNKGAKKAKFDYVAFINGHTILNAKWLSAVNDFFQMHPEIDIVGGPQLNPESDGFFARLSGYALSSVFGAADMSNRYKITKLDLNADEFKLCSANLICKKKVFEKVKFDEGIYPGEDPKFITDAKKAGFKIAYSPDIIVYNKKRDSFSGLIKQIFTYGKKRPQKDSFLDLLKHPVFFFPSLFFLYLVFLIFYCLISSFFHLVFNFWLLLPLVLYLGLSIISSFVESIKNKSVFSLFVLPFVFLTIHISYGTGFLTGLFGRK